jgi:Protein of unknown function (DUF4236)
MGWSFQKSINLGKGLRLNISKRGIGLSGGVKGMRISTGPRGAQVNAGRGPFRYRSKLGSSVLQIVTLILAAIAYGVWWMLKHK